MPCKRLKLAQEKVVGVKQTLKACQRGEVSEVYAADDADSHVIEPVLSICVEKKIPVVRVSSKRELGRACGIAVSCATAAIIKE